jgi:hypothetical protein
MAITVTQVNSVSDTFSVWLTTTNQMANLMSSFVLTANTDANGSWVTGNSHVNGIMSSVTMATTTLRGGNVQSSAVLTISTNVSVTGTKVYVGNTTVNATVNSLAVTLANSTVSYSLIKPTAVQKAGTSYYLNANGSWSEPTSSTPVYTNFTSGNSTVNTYINSTSVSIQNSSVTFTMVSPTAAEQADGDYYLNANGTWVDIFGSNVVIDGTFYTNDSATVNGTLDVYANLTVNGSVTATSFYSGTGTSNISITNTAVTLSNSTVTFGLTKPTAAQQADGTYYLNANGEWVEVLVVISANAQTSGTSAQLVDSFDATVNYSCDYTITVNDNNANNRQFSKILVIHDEGDAYMTEYGVISTNTDVGTFEANLNSGSVRLYFTPVSSNTNVYMRKELIPK